jgi:tubulin polyglutamylase TTLL6/13
MITGQNYLNHVYQSLHPENLENEQCFQVLGLDVLIDSNLKPWLLEINQSPSFHTDGVIDKEVK